MEATLISCVLFVVAFCIIIALEIVINNRVAKTEVKFEASSLYQKYAVEGQMTSPVVVYQMNETLTPSREMAMAA